MKSKIIKSILVPTLGILPIGVVSPIVMPSCGTQAKQILVTSISLNHETLALDFEQTEELTATILPENATNKKITWSSSNESVATIEETSDNKTVKVCARMNAGFAAIIATAEDGSVTATCNVEVKEPIKAESVTINNKISVIETGKYQQLTATVMPANTTNKKVTWTSNDPSVATVSEDGLVYAIGEGEVTIIVETADGSRKVDSCRITSSYLPATDIKLNKNRIQLFTSSVEKGKTEQLTATVSPSRAFDKKVIWESSDNNVAIVNDDGLVTAVSEGSATITAKLNNGAAEDKCEVEVINFTIAQEGEVEIIRGTKTKFTIKSTHDFGKQVTWTTNDRNIVIINSETGEVTGKNNGTCEIKASIDYRTESGTTIHLEDTCQVKVIFIHAESIYLLPNPAILWGKGSSIQFTPFFQPANSSNKKVTWDSSDNSIATVDENGLVTAVVDSGEVTITATAEDGGHTATSRVIIKKVEA